MRIGIDALVLRPNNAGSQRYIETLISALVNYGGGNEYEIFVGNDWLSSQSQEVYSGVRFQSADASRYLPRAIFQQLYWMGKSTPCFDVLHCPLFVPSVFYSGRVLMTVLDLTFLRYPQTQKWTGRFWWRLLGKWGIYRSDRIVAISESTRREILQHYKIPPEKIDVVYPYVHPMFKPSLPTDSALARNILPSRYILYVGTLEPRKNLTTLFQAYAQLRKVYPSAPDLLLIGGFGWLKSDLKTQIGTLGLKKNVFFLGYVPDVDLPAIYSAAELFVYISRYEGFGLPVLEAMACGAPVVASNIPSLSEVIGEAGWLVDPDDVEQISNIMHLMLRKRDIREQFIHEGYKRAALFNKARFANEMLSVYKNFGGAK
jgi:glycosyltransferase involved in cell wall biosynthesis